MSGQKVAFVTGGSRGLGAAICLALGSSGYRVGINYISSYAAAERVAARVGGETLLMQGDVGRAEEAGRMVESIISRWGRLDLLVNNAGVTRDAFMIKSSEADWDRVLKVNLKGCFNTVRAVVPHMGAAGGGHIINISSRSGLRGKIAQAAYSASKAAVLGLTRSLAAELGPQNIRVNAVLPGYLPTGMGARAEKAMQQARSMSMLQGLSSPEETASFIVWLSMSTGITGQFFSIDSR